MLVGEIDTIYEAVGNLVRRHRRRVGLTQEQLGLSVGLSRTSITNLEKGRQHIPVHHLYGIAKALDVPANALLPETVIGDIPERLVRALPANADESVLKWAQKVAS
jgi:transcriptional regulator with XRE-family HTH domain